MIGRAAAALVTGADVVEILARLEAAGVEVWVDGGWGIDALIERETRAHGDLDLAVGREDLDALRAVLAHAGFEHATDAWPGLPARLVLRDARGRQVDFHPLTIDVCGDGWQNLGNGRFGRYPAEGLRGEGRIEGDASGVSPPSFSSPTIGATSSLSTSAAISSCWPRSSASSRLRTYGGDEASDGDVRGRCVLRR
jgi:lincosamide nucleotidyltransferase A/C/D/E